MQQLEHILLLFCLMTCIASFKVQYGPLGRHLSTRHSSLHMNSEKLTVQPIKAVSGEFTLPGSKSLSNRALLLAALSEGTTKVENLLDSADIRYMLGAMKDLNIDVVEDIDAKTAVIVGKSGAICVDEVVLNLGNAGTAMRPLTGVLCAGQGKFTLDGVARMRERPIIDLVDALNQLGVDITCSNTGCPPVVINARGMSGGEAIISGEISSQYLSALLMTGPLAEGKITLTIKDTLMSAPYVHLTMNLMRQFGATVESENDKTFVTFPGKYQSPGNFFIEGDASSASYFLAGAAITGGRMTVNGCGSSSVQGDVRFAHVLEKMGATVEMGPTTITVSREEGVQLVGIDEDCGDIPDVAMTLAVVGVFAKGKTVIRNVYNWRVKETERMVAMVNELTKLGVKVEEGRDFLVVHGLEGGQTLNSGVEIETYDDHRVAMCFSLAACAGVPVTILDPACTSKTFPDYFDRLAEFAK